MPSRPSTAACRGARTPRFSSRCIAVRSSSRRSTSRSAASARCGASGRAGRQAITRPAGGERPLWDCEPGLHKRERAAYLLSEHLGIGVVPPTVIRDGPFGEGSFQWFVDADHSEHYFTIHEQYTHHHDQLREIAVLDVL